MEVNLRCSEQGCINGNHIGGLCLHHYGFIKYNQFMKSWGNVKNKDGYMTGKYNGKVIRVHRLVYTAYTGKDIPEGYVVHHKNGDKLDNRIENLQLMTHQEHIEHHAVEHSKVDENTTHKRCILCKQSKPLNQFKIKEYYKVTGLPKRIGKCNECKPTKARRGRFYNKLHGLR